MPSGRRTTGNGTRQICREMVDLLRADPRRGVRINGAVYSINGQTGKYLIIRKKTETKIEVMTMYITDFVDLIYNGGDNTGAKAVWA